MNYFNLTISPLLLFTLHFAFELTAKVFPQIGSKLQEGHRIT